MIYLKYFETHSDYQTYINGSDKILPNVSYCEDNNDVHYNPFVDPFNGHDYVDLGLPSGTLWATKNVGANNITDSGLYFSWGGTTGYTAAQVGTDKNFTWADYELGDGGSSKSNMTKYNSIDCLTTLEAVDDAATVNMGGEWHMPSKEQIQELLNTSYCTNNWVIDYQSSGVNGILFTSVADSSKTLFIPAAGLCYDSSLNNKGYNSYLWSQSINENNVVSSYCLEGSVSVRRLDYYSRYEGYSVRGVIG